jgi:hypothetical protein
MFDNSMTGPVGFAMHEDRLRRAMANLREIDADQATQRNPVRQAVANVLIALAATLRPSITQRTRVA